MRHVPILVIATTARLRTLLLLFAATTGGSSSRSAPVSTGATMACSVKPMKPGAVADKVREQEMSERHCVSRNQQVNVGYSSQAAAAALAAMYAQLI